MYAQPKIQISTRYTIQWRVLLCLKNEHKTLLLEVIPANKTVESWRLLTACPRQAVRCHHWDSDWKNWYRGTVLRNKLCCGATPCKYDNQRGPHLVSSSHSGRCQTLQGAHRQRNRLHDFFEDGWVIKWSLCFLANLGHDCHLQNTHCKDSGLPRIHKYKMHDYDLTYTWGLRLVSVSGCRCSFTVLYQL